MKKYLKIEAMFESENPQVTLGVNIQPMVKQGFTDWQNWSEGDRKFCHSAI
ncbi:MAG: hypothetical protein FWG22_02755 [Prolixibacteraceae bacterium]|nr:hypothetical protein [Prolixibacteraceae bacterium]